MSKHWEQNKDATVYVGNIDERFTHELLTELMTQAGPVRQVHMPQDRVSQSHQGFGFVEFDTPESADYAAKIMNSVRIYGKPIRVNKASADKQKTVDIGAELFINNLDPLVDEKILFDTFSQFGGILRQPNIIRDENNISKGYGFISFDSFEASDAARANMNGQYLLSKAITVEYAYKKDGKGERHGDEAERKLAREGKKHNILPEQQQLPAAFHMSVASQTPAVPAPSPTAAADPIAAAAPVSVPGVVPPVAIPQVTPVAMHGGPPPNFPAVPPVGPPAMGRPGPPPFVPGGGGGVPPPVGGRMPGLPPAPSGLPARPPPSQVGFGGPADFHPGGPGAFRGPPGPPVGVPPGPPAMYPGPGGMPPPGMPPGPPVGFPGGPPPGAPMPPGFMPPPGGGMPPPAGLPQGFGPPPGPPPNGYPRR